MSVMHLLYGNGKCTKISCVVVLVRELETKKQGCRIRFCLLILLTKKFLLISVDTLSEGIKGWRTKKKVVRKNYKAMFNYHIKH